MAGPFLWAATNRLNCMNCMNCLTAETQRRRGQPAEDYRLLTMRLMPSRIRGTWKFNSKPNRWPLSLRYVRS